MRREDARTRKNQNRKIIRTLIKFKSELKDLCLIVLFSEHHRPMILLFCLCSFHFRTSHLSQLALRARKKRPATKWLPALNFYVTKIVVNDPRASKL